MATNSYHLGELVWNSDAWQDTFPVTSSIERTSEDHFLTCLLRYHNQDAQGPPWTDMDGRDVLVILTTLHERMHANDTALNCSLNVNEEGIPAHQGAMDWAGRAAPRCPRAGGMAWHCMPGQQRGGPGWTAPSPAPPALAQPRLGQSQGCPACSALHLATPCSHHITMFRMLTCSTHTPPCHGSNY